MPLISIKEAVFVFSVEFIRYDFLSKICKKIPSIFTDGKMNKE